VIETGDGLPRLVVPPPGPASRAWAERLARVEARSVTWRGPDFPVFWSAARGSNVEDADGNVYVDLTSAFGVAVAGHAHPEVTGAIREAAGRLVHGMGDVHPPIAKVALLERLSDLSPWSETRGIFASTGSEAVEIALKTAQLATGRSGVLAFEGGYHGLTFGALSVTSRDDFRRPFQDRLFGPAEFVPFPSTAESSKPSLEALDRAFDRADAAGTPIGAVIVEPLQGRGGIRVPPPGFLGALVARTRKSGAVVIFDEIFTGLGRTGALLALMHEDVAPDLLCLGKALGGGLPLSVCLGSREVMDAWPESKGEALHTSTFLGHPLACSAGLALLDVLEKEELPTRSRVEGARLLAALSDALAGFDAVAELRGRGLCVGIQLAGGTGSAARLAVRLLQEGFITLPAGPAGDVLELTPPLTIDRAQLDAAVEALIRAIRDVRP
jgi:4-aminobutyrate aminotransferase-like enzyme